MVMRKMALLLCVVFLCVTSRAMAEEAQGGAAGAADQVENSIARPAYMLPPEGMGARKTLMPSAVQRLIWGTSDTGAVPEW